MSETTFTISNNAGNSVQPEIPKIKATGGREYPRLIVPLRLSLSPIKLSKDEKQYFDLISIHCELFIASSSLKISDAIFDMNPARINNRILNSYEIEFPLDAYRVGLLQNKRAGDVHFRIVFSCLVGLYEKGFISRFERPYAQFEFKIPQSDWVKNILPSWDYCEYFIIEIPIGTKAIQKAWNSIKQAEEAFMKWDMSSVCSHCRDAASNLDKTISNKFGKESFTYNERWGRAFIRFFNYQASLGLHLGDMEGNSWEDNVKNLPACFPKPKKKADYPESEVARFGKPDIEQLLIVTKSLAKYAEELLQEG